MYGVSAERKKQDFSEREKMKNAENKKEPTPTATQAYRTAKFDIANLLGWFECELSRTHETIDWADVGSLNEVRSDLIKTLSFLSGFQEKQIADSLGELSNDNIDEVFESLKNAPQPDWDAITKEFRKHTTENE
jgi:SpoVK/Ycf46/Vps4 family AAA+-type ATPase